MRRAIVLALVLAPLAACRPSESQCARLLDHFIEVEGEAATVGRFREMTPPLVAALGREKRRFTEELRGDFVVKCRAQLSRAEVACATRATDEAGMDRCQDR